jgi:hypothetical protein
MSRFSGLALDVDTPARMTITHPSTGQPLRDGDGEPAWIDLLSMDSPPVMKAQRAAQNRRLAGKARRLTAEELFAESTEVMAAATKGWRLLTLQGDAIEAPCSPGNAAELYAMPELAWLRDQVDSFLADRGNFLRT